MGSDSIDFSLSNVYKSWRLFRAGKRASRDIIEFEYRLEDNLWRLHNDLQQDTYRHGGYEEFEVTDNKKRLIKVAEVRDRVVHRLLYEYLKNIFDKTFIYDVWSCREGKGLLGSIDRTQEFLRRHPDYYVWRSDVSKFFDSVDKEILFNLIRLKITDRQAVGLIKEVLFSEERKYRSEVKNTGIPIGNLTSQIFANIYLNELDRFVKHKLKIKCCLRYGDDFIIISDSRDKLEKDKVEIENFLEYNLKLQINKRNNIIVKACQGLKFLGVIIYPWGRKLNKRNSKRWRNKLSLGNYSSYCSFLRQYEPWSVPNANYIIYELLDGIYQ